MKINKCISELLLHSVNAEVLYGMKADKMRLNAFFGK